MDSLIVLSTGRYQGDEVDVELFAWPREDAALAVFGATTAPTWRTMRHASRWLLEHGAVQLTWDDGDDVTRLLGAGADLVRVQLSPVGPPTIESMRSVQRQGRILLPGAAHGEA